MKTSLKALSTLKKKDLPMYKTPRSVQQLIEIMNIHENGIFEILRNRYSKVYRFTDINYTTTDESEQELIFLRYCKFLNSMDVAFKIVKPNMNRDMDKMKEDVFIKDRDDGMDEYRNASNHLMEKGIIDGKQGIEQHLFLVITIERKNMEEAKSQFAIMEANIHKVYGDLGSDITPLNGNERLQLLYNLYHLYHEDEIQMNVKDYEETEGDFRNDLCNSRMKFYPEYFEDEGKFGRALFVKKYPRSLSDRFITELSSVPVHSIITIDAVPIPKDLTMRVLDNKLLGVENDILKQQRVRNRNKDYSSDISYKKKREKAEIEATIDEVNNNDAAMFYVGVTIVVMARSLKELDNACETIKIIGNRNGVVIDTHYLKQREAYNTALPIGVRQTDTMRSMLTQSLAALMPFNVQELYEPGGVYYGTNQVSKNLNVGDRKKLINGNGFYFGVPGSGKSLLAKQEMVNVWMNTEDDIIVIDPMSEYFEIAETFGGAVINLSSYSENFVNPLDLDILAYSPEERRNKINEKAEFVLSLCEQCMGGSPDPREKSILGRCVKDMYMEIAEKGERYIPVMTDLYDRLRSQPETMAKDIALALELFVNGSLDIFNHPTNVDVDNRFIVYGIRDLGKDLSPLAMLIMMENIQDRIIANARKGRATWLYIDEFHTLLNYEYTSTYLNALWKKVRKQGGLCTGISQNITDLLNNEHAMSIISNSEFIVMLKQSLSDNALIASTIGVSEAQLRYVINAPCGTGILKFGSAIIPFDATIPKDSPLYKLFNTNLHEKNRMKVVDAYGD